MAKKNKSGKKTQKAHGLTTHILIVLDSSGSMGVCRDVTISGFNEYIQDRKKDEGNVLFTLVTFDTHPRLAMKTVPVKEAMELNHQSYCPDGCTALYDACGFGITHLEKSKADRYLVCIMTDGEENASKEYTREQVFSMIKEREGRGNWTFTFLGANQDSYRNAQAMGMQQHNTYNYAYASANLGIRGMSVATSNYMASPKAQVIDFYADSVVQDVIDNKTSTSTNPKDADSSSSADGTK